MTDQDRNIRTLITCFVIALVALVPLRIVESQNIMTQDAMVLGEETYNDEEQFYLEENFVEEEEFIEEDSYVGKRHLILDEYYPEEEIIEEEIVLPNAELE